MRFATLFLLLSLFGLNTPLLLAQNSIFGSLLDETRQEIVSANVLLCHAKDSSLYQGVLSSSVGIFQFSDIPAGEYVIK